jgi:hypothetical protein
VACSTVLAAGAGGTVAFWPSPVAAKQAVGVTAAKVGQSAGATALQDRPGQAITDFETRHADSAAAASLRAAQLAARAAARARAAAQARAAAAKAAQLRAAQLRAAQLAAQSKASASPAAATSPAAQPVTAVASGSPQQIATSLLGSYGWPSSQFSCLDELWNRESGWNPTAENPSGAYGIPQALPGSKMASAGPDWATDATTQIKWGLGYIKGLYGSPCGAWSHEEAVGWY